MKSSILPKFYGSVDSRGELVIDPEYIVRWKQMLLNFKNQKVTVVLDKAHKNRSNNQNAYYWSCVIGMIADETAHTKEEVHSMLGMKFLKFVNGKGLEYVRSTTDLTTTEMEEYLEECRRWASEFLNLYIGLPNEVSI